MKYNACRKIFLMTCFQQICTIRLMNQELSLPRAGSVVIPIPDIISGCISECKFCDKNSLLYLIIVAKID